MEEIKCPKCGSVKIIFMTDNPKKKCIKCGEEF